MALEPLLRLVEQFHPRISYADEDWEFHLPVRRGWHRLWVKRYRDTFYMSGTHLDALEFGPNAQNQRPLWPEQTALLRDYTTALGTVLEQVKKDAVAYHAWLNRALPPGLRKGVVHRRIVHQLLPDYMRFDRELGETTVNKMLQWLRESEKKPTVAVMTSGRFFEYCRIAYRANPQSHEGAGNGSLDGRTMYKRWADGRDEGLTALDPDDAEAFRNWYDDDARRGGHPWEIYRGGNSTHIDLAVYRERPDAEWRVLLSAFSSTRLAETCRIALALHREGLPFELADRESYTLRLAAEDNVGVLPEGSGLKYGWHEFPGEFHVADSIYFSWFRDPETPNRRPTSELKRLVSWFPIRPLSLAAAPGARARIGRSPRKRP
jgi:hypothetical protein